MKYIDKRKSKAKTETENVIESPDILTEPELAEYLGLSVWMVRRLRLNEGLPVLRFNKVRSVLYYRPAVDDWLRSHSAPVGQAEQDDATEEKEPLPEPEQAKQIIAEQKKGRFRPMDPILD